MSSLDKVITLVLFPVIKTALPQIESVLLQIETALLQIETALPQIKTALQQIEIHFSSKLFVSPLNESAAAYCVDVRRKVGVTRLNIRINHLCRIFTRYQPYQHWVPKFVNPSIGYLADINLMDFLAYVRV